VTDEVSPRSAKTQQPVTQGVSPQQVRVNIHIEVTQSNQVLRVLADSAEDSSAAARAVDAPFEGVTFCIF